MTTLTLRRMATGMHGASGQLVAHFAQHQRITIDRIAEEISANCTLTKADIVGCVTALAEMVAYYTTRGYSVALGELGTFTASLNIKTIPTNTPATKPSKPTQHTEAVRVTALSIKRVSFRASAMMRKQMASHLDRNVVKPRCIAPTLPTHSTPEARLLLVQKYLQKYHVISVRQYAALAQISHFRAANELRQWRQQTAVTHIGTAGCGTHKMAIWQKEESD